MDPVSQGVVGALVPQCFARREDRRLAAIAGGLGGMAADLDILIRSVEDPLLTIEYHRHFTHALVFVPLGGLIVAGALWPILRRKEGLSFPRLLAWTMGGYATAGLLDACTSYGTHLFWPFDPARVAWHLVSVIDPLFTLPLVVLSLLAFFRRQRGPAVAAVLFAASYLGVAGLQRERAEEAALALARDRGHEVSRLVVKPSLGNIVVWRSTYVHGAEVHVDAIRVAPLTGASKIYPGDSVDLVDPLSELGDVARDSTLGKDLARFAQFSDAWLAWHPDDPRVLGDVRYATLPDEVRPLWGITVNRAEPDRHVDFVNFRDASRERLQRFWSLLRGD